MLDALLERLPRDDARSFIDLLEHEEAADVAEALSSAGVATGSGGNLLYETLAPRVRTLVRYEAEIDNGSDLEPIPELKPISTRVRIPDMESNPDSDGGPN